MLIKKILNFKTAFAGIACLALLPAGVLAADRITRPVDPGARIAIGHSVHPKTQARYDQGLADPATELSYVTMLLEPDPSLDAFLTALQTPSSPDYHRWVTPEQFAGRFGLTNDDIAKLTGWLRAEGLTVHDVARGRHWITFSGTAAQVGRALHTEFHRYLVNGVSHVANATVPSIPAAFEDAVNSFEGLNDFGLEPAYVASKIEIARPLPGYNGSSGSHYLAPGDYAAIYDITPLYQAGIDGSEQKVAVVGRTNIDALLPDVQSFRKGFGLPAQTPQKMLVGPEPGVSSGDVIEAALDLEWSGSTARNATIVYVYAKSVNTAVQYAIDQNVAPVVTMSYGGCELEGNPGFRTVAQQASAQGITWLVSSGDFGGSTCDDTAPTPHATKGLTADYPAVFPEVTAVGGTTFSEGSGAYWSAAAGLNGGTALSYIPEVAWNDVALTNNLKDASGGAPSAFFSKPVWQTGPGVPADNARDVPDVAFAASPNHDGYYVVYNSIAYSVGGTSAGSPAFAGILALVNQYLTANGTLTQPGLGNINPQLYRMAQTTTDVFHDVTMGNNNEPCDQNSPSCIGGFVGYSAGAGYDLVSGLGSADITNLAHEWNNGTASQTTLFANPASAGVYSSVQLTATVTGSKATPTGTVTFNYNDAALGTATLTGSGGTATASLTVTGNQIAAGSGLVTAAYAGDGIYNSSAGTTAVVVSLSSTAAAVVATVTPSPVYQSEANSTGFSWFFTVMLTEKAGVAATLTGMTLNGANINSEIAFFGSAKIAANGFITASIESSGVTVPATRVYGFSGTDANGNAWSQQVSVSFNPPISQFADPAITLSGSPATVQQNASAPASCQWSQQVTVQEQNGFLIELTQFSDGVNNLTSQIQSIFGTTRLAPWGTLTGTICNSSLPASGSKTYQLAGVDEIGLIQFANLTTAFAAGTLTPATASVTLAPASALTPALLLVAAGASQSATGTASLNFAGGSPQWTAAISPAGRTSKWLTVTPASGAGASQITIQASGAGLSNGVYNATILIQSANTVPQSISVPVFFVVGQSSATTIVGLQNVWSFQSVFAPGMLMSVYGTNLSPATIGPKNLPYPLALAGVSATINGIPAPLYSVSPGQMNVQVPYETGAGPAVLAINNNGQVAAYPFQISVTAPGVYGSAIDNATGTLASSAKAGQVLLLFMTGEGDVTPTLATGATPAAGTAISGLAAPRLPVAVTVGGVPCKISFAGIPSGLAGATQIDITVPANAPLGAQQLVVTVGGVAAPGVPIMIGN